MQKPQPVITLESSEPLQGLEVCSPPNTYRGAVDALFKIVRNEGVFALYKGATPPGSSEQ
ncbi:mitochondrial carrier protein [Moniliophthora roreri]|nr:mitochondrial carrier protein [Moniliophthora roreri]